MAHRIVDNAETSPPGPVADAAHPAGRGRPAVAVNSPVTAVAVNRRGPAAVVEPAVRNVGHAVTRCGPDAPGGRICRRGVAVPPPLVGPGPPRPPVVARPRPVVAVLRRQGVVRVRQAVVARLPVVVVRPVARGPADVRGAALPPVRARPRGPVAHRS